MAARRALPRGVHAGDRPLRHRVSGRALEGMARALDALRAPATGMTHEQALAERAQWVAEDAAKRLPQGCLALEPAK
ncbi:hypothetical protein [Marilutibacter aestuarii]|uniref:hypothetical protein n=1 Tax=Marilutibacter aestuarii TaxID=1706195 RepID=UPI001143ED4E|nr:hypothetical protein [Lysobacter aestuarii]